MKRDRRLLLHRVFGEMTAALWQMASRSRERQDGARAAPEGSLQQLSLLEAASHETL